MGIGRRSHESGLYYYDEVTVSPIVIRNDTVNPALVSLSRGMGSLTLQVSYGDDANGNAPEPAKTEFSMNVGVQFGLTDITSDGALKFQGSLAF